MYLIYIIKTFNMNARKKAMSINNEIIRNLSNLDNLIIKLNSNINDPNLSSQVIFRAIYKILENDSEMALSIIVKYKCNFSNKSYLALLIKIYSNNNMIDDAISIYNKIPDCEKKKRFIIVIYNQLAGLDKYKAFDLLYNHIYNKFVLEEDDINKIYDIKYFDQIMEMLSANEIVINDYSFFSSLSEKNIITEICSGKCSKCQKHLHKFHLDSLQISNLKNNLLTQYIKKNAEQELKKLDLYLSSYAYNIFIDGNNILFFRDRKVNIDSYRRLLIIYEKIKSSHNPLFFIHIRHKNNIKKMGIFTDEANNIIGQLPIYWTPYKMNDDWFFLWAGLSNYGSLVLTNDHLRDHIYKISEDSLISNTLSVWINNNIIKYELVDYDYNIIFPIDYSIKIQKNEGIWHIPISDGRWICLVY